MSQRLPVLLGLLATMLIAVIALELSDTGAGDEAGLPIAAPRQVAGGQPVPASDATAHVLQWAATVLGRPLFSRDRRPPAQSAANVAEVGPLQLPRLSGVLVSASGRRAIFAAAAGGRSIVVGEGAKIGRYTVQKIEAGQVTVAGPEGNLVLRTYMQKAGVAKTGPLRSGLAQPGIGQLGLGPSRLPRAGPDTRPGNPAYSD